MTAATAVNTALQGLKFTFIFTTSVALLELSGFNVFRLWLI